jgi:hypothetical protein
VAAANTVVPAILALEADGFTVTQDPVAVLGLVKLAETRRPWRADDAEVDDVLARFSL